MPRALRIVLLMLCLVAGGGRVFAQQLLNPATPGAPTTLLDAPQRDTTSRTNTGEWRDESVRISFQTAHSARQSVPDTSIHTLHRRRFSGFLNRDLGNHGSAVRYRFFRPEGGTSTGLSLGYHAYDPYRLEADSQLYYNTNRPYTHFTYQLGSKVEQTAQVLHTQNINPRWNFAAGYRKLTSPGAYKIQRTSHDNGFFNTSYLGAGQRYELKAALVYNKEQQDENGGILADSFLSSRFYPDRATIPVALQSDNYNRQRSPVTNVLRDVNFLVNHQYTLGPKDTLYNEDSTTYEVRLTPRFRLGHRMELGAQRHQFKHLQPDSVDYITYGNPRFATNDSVYNRQNWFWFDNRFTLSGFFGPSGRQLEFTAGIGNRLDNFRTEFVLDKSYEQNISNYLWGEIGKEALQPGEWFYQATAQLYFTGPAAGNFLLNARLGKDLGERWGQAELGFRQSLQQAGYAYRRYQTRYFLQETSLSNESVTELYAGLNISRLSLSAGLRSYIMANYIYLADSAERLVNTRLQVNQQAGPFNILQGWISKQFRLGAFVLDNDLILQQVSGGPVHLPLVMGRHQLSYESFLFKKALQIAIGVEARYHTPYEADGYSPFYNRFYYQSQVSVSNAPELGAFFNFRVKRFRSYISVDQLQQVFTTNIITAPLYPSQNMMLRFGFEWIMVN